MIRIDSKHFCYIEPTGAPAVAILDDITRKATALLRACSSGETRYRGWHNCTGTRCTATSDNTDHILPDGRMTHSLLVHYVARHRADVAAGDLAFLASLTDVAEPTAQEIG